MKTIFKKLVVLSAALLPIAVMAQQPKIANFRAYDQTGINVFETGKADSVKFDGLKVRWGAGFTQQFQGLTHENTAVNNTGSGVNRLYPLKPGFMTAQANLFMDVQLADGIRLNVTSYLSARHHNETWVKGGYIQFDKVPFKGKFWSDLMKLATIKIGHFEVNYGDQHFRRSDGGQAIQNPFMEGYIADAFATEIGGEVFLQKNGWFGMLAMTNGMIKGHVDSVLETIQDVNTKRSPSYILKAGFDKKLENVRVRLSGSFYHNNSSAGSGLTLYNGDRTGSNYQNIMEKGIPGSLPASTTMYSSGRFNPGFTKKVNAFMFNGFLKASGLELFATYETASGRSKTETANRKMTQIAGDIIYRFGKEEDVFLGLRYNAVTAALAGFTTGDVKVNRLAIAGGWFLTKNVLLKAEYVNQQYKDFPVADYRNGGKFSGYVIEAVVGF